MASIHTHLERLQDPSEQTRQCALKHLYEHFADDSLLPQIFAKLAKDDVSLRVRTYATSFLGQIRKRSQDEATCQLLAHIIADSKREEGERSTAYRALLNVLEERQLPKEFQNRDDDLRNAKAAGAKLAGIIKFDFERDVDWDLVNPYLSPRDGDMKQ